MARLDDGCCFVFSLLILSKQLAVYSFFLFRFIGASICISLAIPFLSIDPGWLGEDRPAAAFTLQVTRRLFYSPDRTELTYRSAASSYCSPMYATWLRMLLINLIEVAVVTRGKSWIGQVTPYCGMRFSFSTASLFIALLSRQFPPFWYRRWLGVVWRDINGTQKYNFNENKSLVIKTHQSQQLLLAQ